VTNLTRVKSLLSLYVVHEFRHVFVVLKERLILYLNVNTETKKQDGLANSPSYFVSLYIVEKFLTYVCLDLNLGHANYTPFSIAAFNQDLT